MCGSNAILFYKAICAVCYYMCRTTTKTVWAFGGYKLNFFFKCIAHSFFLMIYGIAFDLKNACWDRMSFCTKLESQQTFCCHDLNNFLFTCIALYDFIKPFQSLFMCPYNLKFDLQQISDDFRFWFQQIADG